MRHTFIYISRSALAIVLMVGLFGYIITPEKAEAAITKRVYLTSGTTWTVASDWVTSGSLVETIGAGGTGGSNSGGGGGAYASEPNISLTPGASVTYQIGNAGSDTVFNSTATTCAGSPTPSVCADGGVIGVSSTNGAGGTTANSIGTTEYAGGNGSDGAGGGAAGPYGAGENGAPTGGGQGGGGFGGYGGASGEFEVEIPACVYPGQNGEPGGEYSSIPTYGSGGGGGYGTGSCAAGLGGSYGGGGGGSPAKAEGDGLIVITYSSTETPSSSTAKFKILGGKVQIIGGRVKLQ